MAFDREDNLSGGLLIERATWAQTLRRLMQWADRVSDWQLFAFTVVWVVGGGLVLQFVVLPYVLPWLHWGHGLIAGMDWTNFHTIAIAKANQIQQDGWRAWEIRPNLQLPAGLASALYVLVYPEPWVVLPINGLFFAVAVTAVRRSVTVVFRSPAVGLCAVTPFFLFFSFVPIWGQLHKDVVSGAALALVLTALVQARQDNRQDASWLWPACTAVAGVWLAWLARPYSVFVLCASTAAFVALGFHGRPVPRRRLAGVAGAVLLISALLNVGPWRDTTAMMKAPVPPPQEELALADAGTGVAPRDTLSPRDSEAQSGERDRTGRGLGPHEPEWPWVWRLPRSRMVPPELLFNDMKYNTQRCAPNPSEGILDRLLYSVCDYREGFRAGGLGAGSNHDYELRMRTLEDFVAYSPRALQVALIEPMPNRWGREKTDIGRLASYIVPFEMVVVYGALIAAAIVGRRWLAQRVIWAVLAYCFSYITFFVYTIPNMGTVYRMRAFAISIIVSLALAASVASWVERAHRTRTSPR